MPAETEFTGSALDHVERREQNACLKQTMYMLENVLKHVWKTRPIEETQKLIDRMPKMMQFITEANGGGNKVVNLDKNL